MLRVFKVSGEELTHMWIDELHDVRTLKQPLHKICRVGRFRQKLVHNGRILGDAEMVTSAMDIQMVVLPCQTPSENMGFTDAVCGGDSFQVSW